MTRIDRRGHSVACLGRSLGRREDAWLSCDCTQKKNQTQRAEKFRKERAAVAAGWGIAAASLENIARILCGPEICDPRHLVFLGATAYSINIPEQTGFAEAIRSDDFSSLVWTFAYPLRLQAHCSCRPCCSSSQKKHKFGKQMLWFCVVHSRIGFTFRFTTCRGTPATSGMNVQTLRSPLTPVYSFFSVTLQPFDRLDISVLNVCLTTPIVFLTLTNACTMHELVCYWVVFGPVQMFHWNVF